MALLEGDGEGREAVLRREALVGAVGEEPGDDLLVVLLGGHVERREAVLGLNVHVRARVHQDPHDVLLARERGDVQ